MYQNPNYDNCPNCRTQYIFLPQPPIPPAPRKPTPLPPPPPPGRRGPNDCPCAPHSPLGRRPPYYPEPMRPPFGPGPVIINSDNIQTTSYYSGRTNYSYPPAGNFASSPSRMRPARFVSEPISKNEFLDR